MMQDSFFEDIEKMFEQMDFEFQRMEQAMFPVQQFQIVIEQQPAPDLPAPDFPKPDFPASNLSENLKQIPYEGPAENS